ncbi:polymer-forming cytoskeletal protein [Patescibacteria group bacterium]|nr:polymer-forming cytoskeletal protein [Patescibacteria group bacterium]
MFKNGKKEIEEDFSYEEEDEDAQEESQDTVIAQGVKVEGDFNSKGNVIIEGAVIGSIKTNNNLQVGEKAKISASVSAKDAFISGEVHGNVKIKEKLELSPTSKIYGDIEAKTLIITAGAIFNGKCTMADPNAPSKSKKVKKEAGDKSEEKK